ncbi:MULTISPECIES: protein translocase subunit SecF [unclassified Veillonella]|uniref:protein translocase subunit SecF n=1 Tax=unclassified Veillonella TaxID=2630086 RepID=UPI001389B3E3|nr:MULTISPECIES: protein translocase subunit SecF [unclassified Veillonella]KAF1683992.1 protein translocase subunit SecF [Veillonella sp. R32]
MRFDVIKHHRWWFILSSILVIASLASIFVKGFNWGIDYTGGTIVEVRFEQPVQVSQVREDLKQFGLENAIIQLSGESSATEGDDVIIRTRNLDSNESTAIVNSLNKNIGPNEVKRVESVGAVIGSEVTEHALINLAIAFLVLAAYISFRFEYRIALSSLAAIFHDLIMVLGVFSFFQLEIDASFLAAILTVIGYSMNESVVIFDRIRENTHTHKRSDTFADLANASIAQSIHRSCYTLSTVLFACCSLYFFGGDTTKNFALCMIVGFVSGAYSSICVATSIWAIWKSRNKKDIRNAVKAH